MANSRFLRAFVAAAVMVVAAVPAGAAAAYPPMGTPLVAAAAVAETPPAVSAAMQRDLHLTAEEVRTRRVREAAAPDVERSLRTSLGLGFGGAWLTEDGTLTIGVTSRRYNAAVRAAGATPKWVAYSESQLDAAKAALDRHAEAAPAEATGWYVDLPANRVVITTESGRAADAARSASALAFPTGWWRYARVAGRRR